MEASEEIKSLTKIQTERLRMSLNETKSEVIVASAEELLDIMATLLYFTAEDERDKASHYVDDMHHEMEAVMSSLCRSSCALSLHAGKEKRRCTPSHSDLIRELFNGERKDHAARYERDHMLLKHLTNEVKKVQNNVEKEVQRRVDEGCSAAENIV